MYSLSILAMNSSYLNLFPLPFLMDALSFPVKTDKRRLKNSLSGKNSFIYMIEVQNAVSTGLSFLHNWAYYAAIDFGIFNLLLACCHEPSSTKLLGINTLAVSLAMINSYICNGRWTFNQLSLQPYQISRFTCASLMGMLINSLIVWAGSCIFSDHIILWLNLVKQLAVVSSTWNFLAYKYWVFSPTCTSTARDAACSQPADRKIPSPCHNSNPLQEGGGKIAWLSFLSRLKVACKSCFKSASRSDHPEQKAKIKDPVPPMIPGLISLIIPAYNEAQRLPGRLQQLLEGMPAAKPWEIIIVDDGSSDETLSIIQEWAEKYPCITTLSYQPNQGKGAAVRTGILSAAGEYVLFVDADKAFPPAHSSLHQ